MRSRLFSLHPSIWEVVESRMFFIVVIMLFLFMRKFIKIPKPLLCFYHLYAGMNITMLVAWTMRRRYGTLSKSLVRETTQQ
jgi:hypothetical protein